jgi:hypothetical protein
MGWTNFTTRRISRGLSDRFGRSRERVSSPATSITGEFQFFGEYAEHKCLIRSIVGRSPGIMTEFDNGVAPRSGAEDITHIGDCMAETVALFDVLEGIAKSSSCPRRSFREQLFESHNGLLECLIEGGNRCTAVTGLGGHDGNIIWNEVR